MAGKTYPWGNPIRGSGGGGGDDSDVHLPANGKATNDASGDAIVLTQNDGSKYFIDKSIIFGETGDIHLPHEGVATLDSVNDRLVFTQTNGDEYYVNLSDIDAGTYTTHRIYQTEEEISTWENPNEGDLATVLGNTTVSYEEIPMVNSIGTSGVFDTNSISTEGQKVFFATANSMAFSDDGGFTWVVTPKVGTLIENKLINGSSINKATGRIVVVCSQRPVSTTDIYIYYSDDNGITWQQSLIPTFTTSSALVFRSVYIDSSGFGISLVLYGDQTLIKATDNSVLKTFDYGETWVYDDAFLGVIDVREVAVQGNKAVAYVAQNKFDVAGTVEAGYVQTLDSATTWSSLSPSVTLPSRTPDDLAFTESGNLVIVSNNSDNTGILSVVNSALSSAIAIQLPSTPLFKFNDIGVNGDRVAVACRADNSSALLQVYVSNDGGLTWSVFEFPNATQDVNIYCGITDTGVVYLAEQFAVYLSRIQTPTYEVAFKTYHNGEWVDMPVNNHFTLEGRELPNSHPASSITYTPRQLGNTGASSVQGAIDELDFYQSDRVIVEAETAIFSGDPVYLSSVNVTDKKLRVSRLVDSVSNKNVFGLALYDAAVGNNVIVVRSGYGFAKSTASSVSSGVVGYLYLTPSGLETKSFFVEQDIFLGNVIASGSTSLPFQGVYSLYVDIKDYTKPEALLTYTGVSFELPQAPSNLLLPSSANLKSGNVLFDQSSLINGFSLKTTDTGSLTLEAVNNERYDVAFRATVRRVTASTSDSTIVAYLIRYNGSTCDVLGSSSGFNRDSVRFQSLSGGENVYQDLEFNFKNIVLNYSQIGGISISLFDTATSGRAEVYNPSGGILRPTLKIIRT